MSLSILRLNIITAAALLPAYLRVGAFVPPVISTRCASKESIGSGSRWSAPARSTAAAVSVEDAKNNLKRALVDSKRSTLAPDVVAAVEVGVYALSARTMSTATINTINTAAVTLPGYHVGACFELIILCLYRYNSSTSLLPNCLLPAGTSGPGPPWYHVGACFELIILRLYRYNSSTSLLHSLHVTIKTNLLANHRTKSMLLYGILHHQQT